VFEVNQDQKIPKLFDCNRTTITTLLSPCKHAGLKYRLRVSGKKCAERNIF
jgi:hypothetical protein